MVLFLVLFTLASISSINAAYIISVNNRSGNDVIIRLAESTKESSPDWKRYPHLKEGDYYKRQVLLVEPAQMLNLEGEEALSVPFSGNRFKGIKEQATQYLEIYTTQGCFYCVFGTHQTDPANDKFVSDQDFVYGLFLQQPISDRRKNNPNQLEMLHYDISCFCNLRLVINVNGSVSIFIVDDNAPDTQK